MMKRSLLVYTTTSLLCFGAYSDASLHHNELSQGYEVVVTDLRIPWDAVFLPNGTMLVSERPGNLVYLARISHKHCNEIGQSVLSDGSDGQFHPVACEKFGLGKVKKKIPIETTYHHGEGGLMGMALHPNFKQNHWIYLYNTIEKSGKTVNRVERYKFSNGSLTEKTIIIDDIPGESYHDGGRIAFGPDGYLYITTGDAGHAVLAQDLTSLAGKILRLKDDGTLPPDNPYGSPVYSYGHRNPQGLTWDASQQLWSTEHGPSGLVGGRDELNRIEKGKNYGWPFIAGIETASGMRSPVIQSGIFHSWAPASALYWDGSVFFGGLYGEALFEARIDKNPVELKAHFKGRFGRIRTVVLGPDGYFYIMTSNRDGRGFPREGDDKIIKIDPKFFR